MPLLLCETCGMSTSGDLGCLCQTDIHGKVVKTSRGLLNYIRDFPAKDLDTTDFDKFVKEAFKYQPRKEGQIIGFMRDDAGNWHRFVQRDGKAVLDDIIDL